MNKIIVYWIEDNPKVSSVSAERKGFLEAEYFDFLIFQNIVEVKEYFEMFQDIRNNELHSEILSNVPSAIPDIIIFDYLLSDSLNKIDPGTMFNYSKDNEYKLIKEHSIADRII